jgi:hypothetical protein
LRLRFDGDSGDAPTLIILTTADPEGIAMGLESGRNEVAFYRKAAIALPSGQCCGRAVADRNISLPGGMRHSSADLVEQDAARADGSGRSGLPRVTWVS